MTAPAGLLDRIGSRLFPSPETGGLLTDEDYQAAKQQGLLGLGAGLLAASGPSTQPVGFGQAVGQALQGAQGSFQQALEGPMARRLGQQRFDIGQLEMGVKRGELERKQAAVAAREQIIAKHGAPDMTQPNATAAWIDRVLPEFIRVGDDEMVGRLTQIRTTLGSAASARAPQEIRLGNKVVLRDPVSGKIVDEYPIGLSPRDPHAPDTAAGLREQRMFSREQQLGDDWRQATKQHNEVANHFGTITANAGEAKTGNPAANIGLIFSFMKMQDPGSTVREGEYATAQNAAGVPDRARNAYNKALDGNFLTPEQIDYFVSAGRVVARTWKGRIDQLSRSYNTRAKRWGVDPTIFIDPFEGADLTGSKPPLTSYNFGGAR